MTDLRNIDDLKLGISQAYNLYNGAKRLWSGYHKAVLEDSPVGYWRFEETSGSTVAAEVGSAQTVNGDVELDVTGRLGSGAFFDGTNSYISLPNFGITDGSSPFSFECWVYPKEFPAEEGWELASVVVGFRAENEVFLTMADGTSVPNALGIRSNQDGAWGTRGDTGPLEPFRWYHIVGTYDPASGYLLYLDGSQIASDTTTGTISAGSDISAIGGIPSGTNRYTYGFIDEVAIYDYVLPSSRVGLHYEVAGKFSNEDVYKSTVLEDSPYAFWRLEEQIALIAVCSVDSINNNGAHEGTPTVGVNGVAESYGIGLDGTNDYVSLPSYTGLAQLPRFSLELWAWPNPDTLNSAWSEGVPANWSADLFIFYLAEDNTDRGARIFWDGSTRINITGYELAIGRWHHFVITKSDSPYEMRLYMDGAEIGYSEIPSRTWSSTSVRIGAGNNNGTLTQLYNGLIDEVAVYDHVLTPAQIKKHFLAG